MCDFHLSIPLVLTCSGRSLHFLHTLDRTFLCK